MKKIYIHKIKTVKIFVCISDNVIHLLTSSGAGLQSIYFIDMTSLFLLLQSTNHVHRKVCMLDRFLNLNATLDIDSWLACNVVLVLNDMVVAFAFVLYHASNNTYHILS